MLIWGSWSQLSESIWKTLWEANSVEALPKYKWIFFSLFQFSKTQTVTNSSCIIQKQSTFLSRARSFLSSVLRARVRSVDPPTPFYYATLFIRSFPPVSVPASLPYQRHPSIDHRACEEDDQHPMVAAGRQPCAQFLRRALQRDDETKRSCECLCRLWYWCRC